MGYISNYFFALVVTVANKLYASLNDKEAHVPNYVGQAPANETTTNYTPSTRIVLGTETPTKETNDVIMSYMPYHAPWGQGRLPTACRVGLTLPQRILAQCMVASTSTITSAYYNLLRINPHRTVQRLLASVPQFIIPSLPMLVQMNFATTVNPAHLAIPVRLVCSLGAILQSTADKLTQAAESARTVCYTVYQAARSLGMDEEQLSRLGYTYLDCLGTLNIISRLCNTTCLTFGPQRKDGSFTCLTYSPGLSTSFGLCCKTPVSMDSDLKPPALPLQTGEHPVTIDVVAKHSNRGNPYAQAFGKMNYSAEKFIIACETSASSSSPAFIADNQTAQCIVATDPNVDLAQYVAAQLESHLGISNLLVPAMCADEGESPKTITTTCVSASYMMKEEDFTFATPPSTPSFADQLLHDPAA